MLLNGTYKTGNDLLLLLAIKRRVVKCRFLLSPRVAGGFREFREDCQSDFHLSWYLCSDVVTSYGQKPEGDCFYCLLYKKQSLLEECCSLCFPHSPKPPKIDPKSSKALNHVAETAPKSQESYDVMYGWRKKGSPALTGPFCERTQDDSYPVMFLFVFKHYGATNMDFIEVSY